MWWNSLLVSRETIIFWYAVHTEWKDLYEAWEEGVPRGPMPWHRCVPGAAKTEAETTLFAPKWEQHLSLPILTCHFSCLTSFPHPTISLQLHCQLSSQSHTFFFCLTTLTPVISAPLAFTHRKCSTVCSPRRTRRGTLFGHTSTRCKTFCRNITMVWIWHSGLSHPCVVSHICYTDHSLSSTEHFPKQITANRWKEWVRLQSFFKLSVITREPGRIFCVDFCCWSVISISGTAL